MNARIHTEHIAHVIRLVDLHIRRILWYRGCWAVKRQCKEYFLKTIERFEHDNLFTVETTVFRKSYRKTIYKSIWIKSKMLLLSF